MRDVIDKKYFTGGDIDAKRERDTLARQLRKEGYTVTTKKWSMPDISTKDCYTIYAVRERTAPINQALSVYVNLSDMPVSTEVIA
jgi:hypothetical protein